MLGVLPLTRCCVCSLGSPEWKRLRAAKAADGEAAEQMGAEVEGAEGEDARPRQRIRQETDKQPAEGEQIGIQFVSVTHTSGICRSRCTQRT